MSVISIFWALAAIISFFVILNDNVQEDFRKDIDNIDHKKEWKKRALLLLIPIACLAFLKETPNSWIWVGQLISAIGLVSFLYWTLFDGWLSNKKGYNFWFTGTIDPNDADTDKFLRKLPKWAQISLKVGGSALFLGLYIFFLYL